MWTILYRTPPSGMALTPQAGGGIVNIMSMESGIANPNYYIIHPVVWRGDMARTFLSTGI